MTSERPILVTGAHRTGTTWVGKMLAADSRTAYLSEPLNVWHRPGVMQAPVKDWYTYISLENEHAYLPALQTMLDFRYSLGRELLALRSAKDLLRLGRDLGNFMRGRLLQQRPLIKDPFAVFSVEWFARRLDCEIVITVRHPAGFASSLKKLNWPFDFKEMLEQPSLMKDWLEEDRAEMEAMPGQDIIGQAALLWRMIYGFLIRIRRSHPEFHFVRHEDLSYNPIHGFRNLYTTLGLEFTPQVEKAILNSSSSENPVELTKRSVHSVKLDSRANVKNWKKRLNKDELARIRAVTKDTALEYYPDIEW